MINLARRAARVVGDLTDSVIIHKSEIHQHPERQLLSRLLPHLGVDCVFDVGANRGQYASQLRKEVGYTGHIISFEPTPDARVALVERSAGDRLWHVSPLALGDAPGEAMMNVMASDDFSSLHRPACDLPAGLETLNAVARKVAVTISTLAVELPLWRERLGFQRPFLKMDTQGHDLAVFQGAGALITEFVGLQSEMSLRHFYADAPDFYVAYQVYRAAGFKPSGFVSNTAGHFPDLHEFDCIMYRP